MCICFCTSAFSRVFVNTPESQEIQRTLLNLEPPSWIYYSNTLIFLFFKFCSFFFTTQLSTGAIPIHAETLRPLKLSESVPTVSMHHTPARLIMVYPHSTSPAPEKENMRGSQSCALYTGECYPGGLCATLNPTQTLFSSACC